MTPDDRHERDQHILSRLAAISHKVDSIDQTQAFALRADAERHFEQVRQIFGRSERRARVYLAANGRRTVGEIAAFLRINSPNVSVELKTLADEGLLEIILSAGGANYWGKKAIDRTLRITKFLRGEFSLDADGRDEAATRRKR